MKINAYFLALLFLPVMKREPFVDILNDFFFLSDLIVFQNKKNNDSFCSQGHILIWPQMKAFIKL